MSVGPRRQIRRARLIAGALLLLLGACGDGDGDGPPVAVEAEQDLPDPPAASSPPTVADDRLPFDLGPGIVVGGDDVVADGIDVALDRFQDAVADPPRHSTATASRLTSTEEDEARVREAAASLLGIDAREVDIHYDGGWFEFHAEGHGHDDVPPETTVPARNAGAAVDRDTALASFSAFLRVAGLEQAAPPAAFDDADHLSVEAPIDLVEGTRVLRAVASVTFGPDGRVIGGYGPLGEPAAPEEVDLVDVPTAIRRLALTQALAGYPTTAPPPAGSPPVVLVSAELALSLRAALGPNGTPTGERWLLPVYRFVDDAGKEWEVNAVVADHLVLPAR